MSDCWLPAFDPLESRCSDRAHRGRAVRLSICRVCWRCAARRRACPRLNTHSSFRRARKKGPSSTGGRNVEVIGSADGTVQYGAEKDVFLDIREGECTE